MKRTVFSALAILGLAASASAAPIALPADSPLFFQFVNLEQVETTALGKIDVPDSATQTYGLADNWGVFIITNIQTGFVPVGDEHLDIQGTGINDVYNGSGGQIYGIFYDIQNTSGTTATSGHLDLYWSDSTAVSLATANPDSTTVTNFTSGTFLARLDFASGIDSANPTTFIKSDIDAATLAPGSTTPGHADSYANVNLSVEGAWTNALNGDWFNTAFGTRDIRFSNFFNRLAAGNPWEGSATDNIVGLRSNDPGRVFTSAVPEPASLTLLGFGLASLGYRRRRKKA